MKAVRFFGSIGETTGYSVAAKNMAQAFSISAVNTKFQFGQEAEKAHSAFVSGLNKYSGDCQIDFYLHGPPWDRHKSNNYKIAYFYWEADTLPPSWIRSINKVNEIWAPCELVKAACLRAGFKGRIKVIPTPSKAWGHDKKISIPSSYNENYIVADDIFKFYSISQWHERKGFRELISAYWSTFTPNDRVLLIVKTSPLNPLKFNGYDINKIKADIFKIRTRMGQKPLPPFFLSTSVLSTEEIQSLHNTGDCYVSPHHGEGWGLPIHDAMLAGKEIITTKFGGVTEYLDNNSAFIIPHTLGPVVGMDWAPGIYNNSQKWAHPSLSQLGNLMRQAYQNRNGSNKRGQIAKQIASGMVIENIARIIEREIESI